jgi:hypothetical protein
VVNRATEELNRSALISSGPEGFDFSLLACVATVASGEGVLSSSAADVGVSINSSLDARGPLQ